MVELVENGYDASSCFEKSGSLCFGDRLVGCFRFYAFGETTYSFQTNLHLNISLANEISLKNEESASRKHSILAGFHSHYILNPHQILIYSLVFV